MGTCVGSQELNPELPSASSMGEDKAHVLGVVWLYSRTIVSYLFEDCNVPRKLMSSFADFIKDIFQLRPVADFKGA